MSDTKENLDFKKTALAELKKAGLTVVVMAAIVALVYFAKIPNPNVVLLTGLVVCTAIFGYISGAVAALIVIIYSLFYFSVDNSFINFTQENGQKIAVIIVGVVVNVIIVGGLKRRQFRTEKSLIAVNRVLMDEKGALEETSRYDALTGLLNRYALRADFARYEDRELYVMIIDTDDFKKANDTYGHIAGDYVLQSIGTAIAEIYGKVGTYRYGGDEFLVVHEYEEENEFILKSEELSYRMRNLRIKDQRIPIRFSAGYVYGHTEAPDDLRLMIRQADAQLYDIKNAGKNRTAGAAFDRALAKSLADGTETETKVGGGA
ncbi:MAG: GGDEF domain-containing protein [Clostridia bacterium]|nr:GGDEF domain-containing protein [Clostridia bacterium]